MGNLIEDLKAAVGAAAQLDPADRRVGRLGMTYVNDELWGIHVGDTMHAYLRYNAEGVSIAPATGQNTAGQFQLAPLRYDAFVDAMVSTENDHEIVATPGAPAPRRDPVVVLAQMIADSMTVQRT
jgi:hypothetical protein